MKRLKEPSTWAGFAAIATGIGQLIASNGADVTAWANICGGLAAVLIPEKGAAR